MSTTALDQAISGANQLINLCQTFKALRQQLNDFVTAQSSEGWQATWAAMATAAQNADGSLGAADGSPNVAHPIDTRVTTQAALAKAVSKTKLTNGVVFLQQLQNMLTNAGVTTANYNASVDDLAS